MWYGEDMQQTAIVQLVVDEASAGMRLDRFVAAQRLVARDGTVLSRSVLRRAIDAGSIRVNEQRITPHYAVRAGDIVTIDARVFVRRTTLMPDADVAYDVLYACDDFLIINKPPGLLVHPVGFDHAEPTLAHGLLAHYPEIATVGEDALRPGIVHRLDRETSGVMVVARTQHAFAFFKHAFAHHRVRKTYYALVHNCPVPETGVIDFPIARSVRGDRHRALRTERDKHAGRVRSAQTAYRVMCTNGTLSAICAMPRTGRTHQIRVHMHALGCPIVGDALYTQRRTQSYPIARHALHSGTLAFCYANHLWRFSAPLPQDMATLWREACATTAVKHSIYYAPDTFHKS